MSSVQWKETKTHNNYVDVSSTWEAVAAASSGHKVEELDASLYCDYSCLRGGCRQGCKLYRVFDRNVN